MAAPGQRYPMFYPTPHFELDHDSDIYCDAPTPGPVWINQYLAGFRDALTTILISRFLLALGRFTERQAQQSGTSSKNGALTTHILSNMSEVTFILPEASFQGSDSMGEV
ncbi:hypothetical protein C8Q76DRAFT_798544 [Earliella scabrosa]|nr:hypothetical protein C8Q76DRAFT_798544 [Earliella scabrosa]